MSIFDRKKRGSGEAVFSDYDYLTAEARERTAAALFDKAAMARTAYEPEWQRENDYYNFIRDAYAEVKDSVESGDGPPPVGVPDPYIMVESQIDPNVPEPEFRGRDDDKDSKKAKEREGAVRYVCDTNRIWDMNTANERRLMKYGDAFWKGFFDVEMRCGVAEGDIRLTDVPIDAIYMDPSVRDGDLQNGEYLDHIYDMHKVKFARKYGRQLKKLGVTPKEIVGAGKYVTADDLFDLTTSVNDFDDTVQVLEHWFKWPEDGTVDGKKVYAGTVACSIQAGGREIKLVPCFWEKTWRQCKLFPFVHYWRIRDENSPYNKSELFSILPMVDCADRKLYSMLHNDELMGNDVIVSEENALANGWEITNEPGSEIRVKPGMIDKVRRLGGLTNRGGDMQTLTWFSEQMQRANRNFETSQGKETTRTTTASGLAMLRSDADEQADIKQSDRNAGFERLYELIDWLCLEFFDDDRLIFLGVKENVREEPVRINYNSDKYAREMPEVRDQLSGEVVREAWTYYPKVDVTVSADDSVVRGKQATLNALTTLANSQITADNWKVWAAALDVMDLPGKDDIIDDWRMRFGGEVDPALYDALARSPELQSVVAALAGSMGAGAPADGGMGVPSSGAAAPPSPPGKAGTGLPMDQAMGLPVGVSL